MENTLIVTTATTNNCFGFSNDYPKVLLQKLQAVSKYQNYQAMAESH
jgi:hypothetical protein